MPLCTLVCVCVFVCVSMCVFVCVCVCVKVVEKLTRGLAMEDSRNMFALCEHNDSTDKASESRTVVADVRAKFEK